MPRTGLRSAPLQPGSPQQDSQQRALKTLRSSRNRPVIRAPVPTRLTLRVSCPPALTEDAEDAEDAEKEEEHAEDEDEEDEEQQDAEDEEDAYMTNSSLLASLRLLIY